MNIEPNWEQAREEQRRLAQRLAVKRLTILLVVVIVGYVIGYPIYVNLMGQQQAAQAVSRLKQLTKAALLYTQDNEDRLPPEKYEDALAGLLHEASAACCPVQGDLFGMNPRAAGLTLTEIGNKSDLVLFYVGHDGVPDFRYNSFSAVSYADGTAKRIDTKVKLVWDPAPPAP